MSDRGLCNSKCGIQLGLSFHYIDICVTSSFYLLKIVFVRNHKDICQPWAYIYDLAKKEVINHTVIMFSILPNIYVIRKLVYSISNLANGFTRNISIYIE